MPVTRRMDSLTMEGAFEVLAKARALEAQGRDIIHLEIGEPDFDTPTHIAEAAVEALHQGYTHYGPTAGLPELREALAYDISRTRGIEISPESVVVAPGAKPILFFAVMALAQRGDEVIYPNPGFPIYESLVRFCGAKPVPMRLVEAEGYHPDLDDLAAKLTPRTKLIILNSPHNPTGAVWSRSEVETLASLLRNREDVYLLSDVIYKDLIYNGQHHSIASQPDMASRTIIMDGFSKSFAMTGWRLGYGAFPKELVPHIIRLASNAVSCPNTFVQRAALRALDGPKEPLRQMLAEFRRRRDMVVNVLRQIPGFNCPLPEGAFYAFPSIRGTGLRSTEFQERAMTEAGVALLSGTAFGKYGEGYLRLSYANSQENLRKALERLESFVTRIARKPPR